MSKRLLVACLAGLCAAPALAATEYVFRPQAVGKSAPAQQAGGGGSTPATSDVTLSASGGAGSLATGDAYAATLAASGPVSAWSLSSGPAWLTIAANGPAGAVVSGSPPAGTTTFTYVPQAVDAQGRRAAGAPVTVSVSAPSAEIVDLPERLRGEVNLTGRLVTNLPDPTWLATASNMNLRVSADGDTLRVRSGYVYRELPATITVTAQSGARSASATKNVVMLPSVGLADVPLGYRFTVGSLVDVTLKAAGIYGTASWRLLDPLPEGLSYDPDTGRISGSPTDRSTMYQTSYKIDVAITDSFDGVTGQDYFHIEVDNAQIAYEEPQFIRVADTAAGSPNPPCTGVGVRNVSGQPATGMALRLPASNSAFETCSGNLVASTPSRPAPEPECSGTLPRNGVCYLGLRFKPNPAAGTRAESVMLRAAGTSEIAAQVMGTAR